ncbi:GNAT family N-acetyltransferase [Halostagnicola kamekurae]|uniref:Acetyltransferase (GNAT) family protein n=1 Tax=Halostagnicola kamekurae TaxID=619731 RepID=A0A1I6SNW4_9EURY|nr:GNAT family N-acetyltransferase [Halostagnicola kamekurae]SFS78639.1 Acetyltransferase (GNAT) family protein [Halostagnicola kamekurae]
MIVDEPVVEPATTADLEAIVDYWVALARDQREYGSYILPDRNRDAMREILAAHSFDGRLLVARVDDTVAGFASFSIEEGALSLSSSRAFLSNLYVRPAYRDRGIGTQLLRAVENAAAARGADDLILETMAGNEAARRFYRRAGYEPFRVAMERSLSDRTENDTHSKGDE